MKRVTFILGSLFCLLAVNSPHLCAALPFSASTSTSAKRSVFDVFSHLKLAWNEMRFALLSLPGMAYQQFLADHPHNGMIAHVRPAPNDSLCDDEKAFLEARKLITDPAIKQIIGHSLHGEVPTIAICCSGGGFRSMLFTLGFLLGLQDADLLDTVTYAAGLSGATWALAPWIASKKDLEEYTYSLCRHITEGIDHLISPHELRKLISLIIEKVLHGQHISAMDIYGSVLANTLLKDTGDNRLDVTLTDSHASVLSGMYPFPIYAAISTDTEPYEWFEFTSCEIGGSSLGAYIPTWAFGRKFKYGTSLNTPPEQTLGHAMGIFGSAFEVDLEDMLRITSDTLIEYADWLPDAVAEQFRRALTNLAHGALDEVRLFPSMVPNFAYRFDHTSPWSDEKIISFVDAGIDFNLPFPPLLRHTRHVDIIIVCDASSDVSDAPELQAAQAYARRNGLPFPEFQLSEVSSKSISLIEGNPDENVPTIIYIPCRKNEEYSLTFDPDECVEDGPCNTFNFTYAEHESKELMELARYVVNHNADLIKNAIRRLVVTS